MCFVCGLLVCRAVIVYNRMAVNMLGDLTVDKSGISGHFFYKRGTMCV